MLSVIFVRSAGPGTEKTTLESHISHLVASCERYPGIRWPAKVYAGTSPEALRTADLLSEKLRIKGRRCESVLPVNTLEREAGDEFSKTVIPSAESGVQTVVAVGDQDVIDANVKYLAGCNKGFASSLVGRVSGGDGLWLPVSGDWGDVQESSIHSFQLL